MNQHPLSRREALKTLAAAVGVVGLSTLPEQWHTPLIETGALPAHAATSVINPAFYRVALVRQLTPCENEGKHHIFIEVKDREGNGVNGAIIKVQWADGPDGFVLFNTATRANFDFDIRAGLANFAMFKGSYFTSIFDIDTIQDISEVAGPVTPDYGVNEACGDNEVANSLYHVSFEIVFQQV